MVADLDEDQNEFRREVFDFDIYMETLGYERQAQELPHVPGLRIEKLIAEMDTHTIYTRDDMSKYSFELWKTLEEYEENIKA